MHPYPEDVEWLCTIPCVERVTAWGLLAEIGSSLGRTMSRQLRKCGQATERQDA